MYRLVVVVDVGIHTAGRIGSPCRSGKNSFNHAPGRRRKLRIAWSFGQRPLILHVKLFVHIILNMLIQITSSTHSGLSRESSIEYMVNILKSNSSTDLLSFQMRLLSAC